MNIYKYKSKYFLLILLLISFSNVVYCDTFSTIRNILSSSKIENNYFINKQINISSNLNYIYTEYSSDSLFNKNYIHSHKIQFHSPIINKTLQFGGSYHLNYSNYQKILNSEYTFGSINLLSKNYDLYLKTKINNHFLKFQYNYKSIENDFLLKIHEFPYSQKNLIENKYFYDLLEPTFGDSITFAPKIENHIININYTAPKIFNVHPFINLQYQFTNINIYEKHLNITTPKLDGERQTQIGNNFNPYQIKIGIISKNDNKFFLGYNEIIFEPKWKQIIYPNDYDIHTLADGNFKFSNLEFGYNNRSGNNYYYLGASQGTLKLQQELSTPVLGYLFILPIAHQLNLDLEILHKTQIIQYGYFYKTNNFIINSEFGYIHSFISINMDYSANLEFGLTSIDENKDYLYDVNLFNLKVHSSYNYKKYLQIYFDCSQIIPYIRKISDEGPSIKPDGIKRKQYGGLMIEIGIKYYY